MFVEVYIPRVSLIPILPLLVLGMRLVHCTSHSLPTLINLQTLLDSRASLEQERAQLVGSQTSLQTQVQQLQSSLSQVQQELQESHSELEASKRGEGNVATTKLSIYCVGTAARANHEAGGGVRKPHLCICVLQKHQ